MTTIAVLADRSGSHRQQPKPDLTPLNLPTSKATFHLDGKGSYASPDCAVADSVWGVLDLLPDSVCIRAGVDIAED